MNVDAAAKGEAGANDDNYSTLPAETTKNKDENKSIYCMR